jgi:hypothetical protein
VKLLIYFLGEYLKWEMTQVDSVSKPQTGGFVLFTTAVQVCATLLFK